MSSETVLAVVFTAFIMIVVIGLIAQEWSR